MRPVGYKQLQQALSDRVPAPALPAYISSSVNKRTEKDGRVLFPSGVAIQDTPLGHAEFALRHERLDLAILRETLLEVPADDIARRYKAAPNGVYVRQAIHYWEWFHGKELDVPAPKATGYEPLLDSEVYEVAGNPTKNLRFRILDNHLGNVKFCPVALRAPDSDPQLLPTLVAELQKMLARLGHSSELYERTLAYLYLSETRSSFRIEREEVPATKERAFARLLQQSGEKKPLTGDWLVDLQQLAVRSSASHEFNFRGTQNWLEDNSGRVSFLPPAPAYVHDLMDGLMEFANDTGRGVDPMVKAACASFGFVYIHPFKDGNGRLHRFLLHHILAQSGQMPDGVVIPVSAVLLKEGERYLDVLKGFSEPVTDLWEYRRAENEPLIVREPGASAYMHFNATRETALVRHALTQAVRVEVPNGMTYLEAYRLSRETIDREFDLPSGDISTLVKTAVDQGGHLSKGRRDQFKHISAEKLDRIESIVKKSMDQAREALGGEPVSAR